MQVDSDRESQSLPRRGLTVYKERQAHHMDCSKCRSCSSQERDRKKATAGNQGKMTGTQECRITKGKQRKTFLSGWPKSSFRFSSVMWKNQKELFGQPNRKQGGIGGSAVRDDTEAGRLRKRKPPDQQPAPDSPHLYNTELKAPSSYS